MQRLGVSASRLGLGSLEPLKGNVVAVAVGSLEPMRINVVAVAEVMAFSDIFNKWWYVVKC